MTALPAIASVAVSAADLTDSLLKFRQSAELAQARMNALVDALFDLNARVWAGRRWARGPRRGVGMRRRALHLKARRP